MEEVVNEEKEIDLKEDDEISKLKAENEKLKNSYAMAYADTENIRKRLNAEAETLRKYRIQSFALDILPIIDNLERAIANEAEGVSESYRSGIKMIYDQLIASLNKEGVAEVEALNKEFDPAFMQSIMAEKIEGVEKGIVVEVYQKGYKLKDRILRAAMVKVAE